MIPLSRFAFGHRRNANERRETQSVNRSLVYVVGWLTSLVPKFRVLFSGLQTERLVGCCRSARPGHQSETFDFSDRMDANTAMITGAGTVLCGLLVLIIFIFGFREKTFEEALDEQRRRGGALIDLIGSDKARVKKPKNKPSKKKDKEAKSESAAAAAPTPATAPNELSHPHVEFKFPEAEEVAAPQPEEPKKKNNRKNKVKPILHNREEHSPLAEEEPVPANHFEEILPKDDVLLKRSISKEDVEVVDEPDVAAEEEVPPPLPPRNKAKVNGKAGKVALNTAPNEPPRPGKVSLNVQVSETPAPVVQPLPQREKKQKKKPDQQLINSETVTLGVLLPLLQKADLSESEHQQLVDQLLNRGSVEWVGARPDPMARLKKQLAEKEKALAEEQQTSQGVHAKLVELRSEINTERTRHSAMYRQLEEQLAAKKQAIQLLNSQLQNTSELQNKNAHATQLLQNQLAEERKIVRALTEEKNAALKNLSAQVDVNKLTQAHQEEVSQLQSQIASAQGNIADLEKRLQVNQNLQDELRNELNASKQLIHSEQHSKQLLQDELAAVKNDIEKISLSERELEQKIKLLENELKLSQEEAVRLRAEAAKAAAVSVVPDFSDKVKELEDRIAGRVQEKDALLATLQSEASQHASTVDQLKEELEAQRLKNNDLRSKNWKAMEAVKAAENNFEAKKKECERLTREAVSKKAQGEEQDTFRQLLQRLFPSVTLPVTKDQSEWVREFEAAAAEHLREASSEQAAAADGQTKIMLEDVESRNKQLQALVTHYKSIIEETEGMLNKLEKHVEQEETRWRTQLQLKQDELDAVQSKLDANAQNESRLKEADDKLSTAQDAQAAAQKQVSELQARLGKLSDDLSSAKKSQEENEALTKQLSNERSRSQQLEQQIKELDAKLGLAQSNHIENKPKDATLNSNTNGPSLEASISESGSGEK
ncbi:ribosome-binding protein 1-like isoform X3 [Cloeon dipterum]|uniref:ribosome-binding protein 1-like isoform X3 n=1 Tax=Cloeon dipterum TaxID=197152 RepID=UPI003220360C